MVLSASLEFLSAQFSRFCPSHSPLCASQKRKNSLENNVQNRRGQNKQLLSLENSRQILTDYAKNA